ncbi:Pleiotropic drug resistance protein 3, partial [Linum perenne]
KYNRIGVKLDKVEVRFRNVGVEAECNVVNGKPLPTLWNSLLASFSDVAGKLPWFKPRKAKLEIIHDVSGIIKPGRITLLLGPPGSGKTSLLKALSGNLSPSLKVHGEVCYNGYKLDEFVPQKTSAYISQYDEHIPEMTVREILDFSARCQGIGTRAEMMEEVSRREKQAGIVPDPDIDTYMKAISVKGLRSNLQTDYILKILGLDICANTLVGDVMRRGISGGQKKRLTTGEMIVGPTRALFMDEITNGLDSSTAFRIILCLQQMVHITDATVLVSLLQPAPETFSLFDDLIMMAEGRIVYHGPREHVLDFFQECGFRCPERKGVSDFIQEVISRKDQSQYWLDKEVDHSYVSVEAFSNKFKRSRYGKKLDEEMSVPCDRSKIHESSISFNKYSLSKWELLKACSSREILLMRRNSFTYVFKTIQLLITAIITMTVFLGTRMDVDVVHANLYMGSLFYGLVILVTDGIPELPMTVQRLQVFHKQKDLYFYPAWAYAIPASLLKVPISFVESLVWTCLTYYVIGYSPEATRFFRQFLVLFGVHLSSVSMFRFIASVYQTHVVSMAVGSFSILFLLMFSGFVIAKPSMSVWLKWSFWITPVTYGEISLSLNEFRAPRWQKIASGNLTVGESTLQSRGLNFPDYMYWISVGALFGFTLLFNIGYVLALTYLKYTMALPFTPLTMVFEDVQYFVDTPAEMREKGFKNQKLQLLSDITGALQPGVLTALMGVSGAGKTTLLDVLAGRKTSGYIEGEIKIGGYRKVQQTFARVSGYCEQTDIHSPQITVEESVMFSAWMRLSPEIDSKTKAEFVKQVIETIELEGIKDDIVGIPGVNGLSTEQRKRLTIAVELVANPSIIFMDEPTTGLDARSAAIVMRAVKNIVDTGRTIVCTIHQPSINIFESFDKLILLKAGGRIIYSGPMGHHSSNVIDYFERIEGVPKIKSNYNPATWMLEVTSESSEAKLGVDFAQLYNKSALFESNKEIVSRLGSPPPDSTDLHFSTQFSQHGWSQFKACLWKQHLSYWRSPGYNLMRLLHTFASSLIFGMLFWDQGQKVNNQQNLFNILGSMYVGVIFLGINNCSSVLQYVATERTVMYRERFAGMYSTWSFSFAQVSVEVPYLLSQAVLFTAITYPMIGYYPSATKVLWFCYTMFCSLAYFNYLGMLLVSLTPNFMIASILQSIFYTNYNLFTGFLIPLPKVPKWWLWLYYLTPTSWSLNGLLTSQYGDIEKELTVFGQQEKVAEFLKTYFGFNHEQLGLVAAVLIAFPLAFAVLFAYFMGRFNFQRR